MSKSIKKICVVTGTRADYGIYTPLLEKLQQDRRYELGLLVTGMHLSPIYGYTVQEIEKDGYSIISKVDILLQGSSPGNMARSIGMGIIGMTQALESYLPDLLIILGDRGEMLAAAISASHLNIPVAHLHGGEVSGSIDESVRHSITKLSHIHFPATQKSAERLIKMGEDGWRVHPVGALRIDTILHTELPTLQSINEKYDLNVKEKEYLLLVFHPVTTEINSIESQIRNILSSLLEVGKDIICILPNSDSGTNEIIKVYNEYSSESSIRFVTNFNHLDYLTVLKNSRALVGNSSSGILEAASFHIPVLNIGNRQRGRERSQNVIDVSTEKEQIRKGLLEVMERKSTIYTNIYGDGNSSDRILDVLDSVDVDENLLEKIISY